MKRKREIVSFFQEKRKSETHSRSKEHPPSQTGFVKCPVCEKSVPHSTINSHIDSCVGGEVDVKKSSSLGVDGVFGEMIANSSFSDLHISKSCDGSKGPITLQQLLEEVPISLCRNVLPPDLAEELLGEMVIESSSFRSPTSNLFDQQHQAPRLTHTFLMAHGKEVEALVGRKVNLEVGDVVTSREGGGKVGGLLERAGEIVEEKVNASTYQKFLKTALDQSNYHLLHPISSSSSNKGEEEKEWDQIDRWRPSFGFETLLDIIDY